MRMAGFFFNLDQWYSNSLVEVITYYLLKKWANRGLFFVYFRSFQTNNTIITTNQCENVMSLQYMAPEFEPTTFRS